MIVLCDFDNSAVKENVAELLLDRFSSEGPLQDQRQQVRRRELTLKDYQECAFSLVREERETLKQYSAEHATLREGFVELAEYCKERGIELAIVSCGLDFYVEGVLERHGLEEIPYYAVEVNFSGQGMGYTYRYTKPDCQDWGTCKCRVLEQYRNQSHQVIYVGDGRSDLCVAQKADLVLARTQLLEFCQDKGIPHRPLRDFHDVIDELEQRTHASPL